MHPQTEEYWGNVNPIGPRGCYDEAKRFAEALTMAYHREHGVETRIVRIFNTYGPRMRLHDGRVVPAFISQALKNKPLTVFGKGEQTRSFCYVSDLIEGIYRLMMSDYALPVNIGNPTEMTMLSSRGRSSAPPVRAAESFSSRCRRTTRSSAGRTSPEPGRFWSGSRGCRWRKGWSKPSSIFVEKYEQRQLQFGKRSQARSELCNVTQFHTFLFSIDPCGVFSIPTTSAGFAVSSSGTAESFISRDATVRC